MRWSETLKTLKHLLNYIHFRNLGYSKNMAKKLADVYSENNRPEQPEG